MASSLTVLKNIFWLWLDPALRILIGIPLAGFVARRLGLVAYGEFHLALSFVVMFGVVANLGLNEVLTRWVAQHPGESQRLWSSAVALKAGLLIGYVGLVASTAWLLGYSSDLLRIILVLGTFQGLMSLDNSARAVFMGHQQMKTLGWMDTAKVLLDAALSVLVLLAGFGAIALAGVKLAVMLAALAGSTILLSRHFQVRLARPQLDAAVAMLSSGLRFAAISAVAAIYARLGFLLLQHSRGAADVALASTAMMLAEKCLWFVPATQGAIFPFFSQLHVTAQDRFGGAFARALRYQALMAVATGLALSLLGPWLIRLLFPPDFWAAGAVVEILGGVCLFRVLGGFFSTILLSQGRETCVSGIQTLQCGVFVVATLALAPPFGVRGFAWAYLVAEALAVVVQVMRLRRTAIFQGFSPWPVLGPLGGGLAVFLAYGLIPGGRESFVGLSGAIAVFVVVIVATRGLSYDDLRYLRGLLTVEKASGS